MNRLRSAFGALACGVVLTACGPGSTTMDVPDSNTPTDGMMMGDAVDTMTPTDATDAMMMGGDAGVCRMIGVEDLNSLGTRMNNTLSYSGNNRSAADSTTSGLQPPSGQTVCNFRTTRQRIFVYTVQADSAVRITTTNPGTPAEFDTTLSVAIGPNCTTATRVSFCNDDDPTPTTGNRPLSSLVTTTVQRRGTRLFIALGGFVGVDGTRNAAGEQGDFQLTVTEIAPSADGQPCDVAGLNAVCGLTSTCVGTTILSDMGTCRANGSVAGAACAAGNCMGTLQCDSMSGTDGICFENVADGMACQRFSDAWQRCGMDSTCVNLQRGAVTGTCRANGTVPGAACNTSNACTGAGLQCVTPAGATAGLCLTSIMANGMCRTWDSACPDAQDCVATAPGGTPGTCRDDGTVATAECNASGGCTAPLACTPLMSGAQVCLNNVTSGQPCGTGDQCPMTDTCYLTDPGNRFRGICRAPGAEGGDCRTSGTACDTGLVCSDTMTPANGRCLRMGTMGGACRIFGTTLCPTGSSCVRTGSSGLDGTCVADGTGPGSQCREMGTRCDGALQCTAMTGTGLCQAAATTTCDPRFGTNRCPTGQWCRASGYDTGTCVPMPAMETEPNNNVMGAPTLTSPASVAGTLSRFDADCFSVAVPANGRIFARVNAPGNGFCYAGGTITLGVDLYDTSGRLLGGDTNSGSFGCPRIDGSDPNMNFSWASNLPAGNYTLCVRNTADGAGAVANGYVLDVAASN